MTLSKHLQIKDVMCDTSGNIIINGSPVMNLSYDIASKKFKENLAKDYVFGLLKIIRKDQALPFTHIPTGSMFIYSNYSFGIKYTSNTGVFLDELGFKSQPIFNLDVCCYRLVQATLYLPIKES